MSTDATSDETANVACMDDDAADFQSLSHRSSHAIGSEQAMSPVRKYEITRSNSTGSLSKLANDFQDQYLEWNIDENGT